jgi:hypothetical protein
MAKQDRPAVFECFAFTRVDDLLLLCTQGEGDVPARDFDAWIERLGVNDFSRILIHDRGGQPSARQRQRIAEFWKSSGRPHPRVALLTNSAVMRYLMTALEWILNAPTRCLPLDQVDQALAYLEFKGSAAQVEFAIRDLHEALSRQRERPAQRV